MDGSEKTSASAGAGRLGERMRADGIRASQAPRPPEMDRATLSELARQLEERATGLASLHRITLALASARRPAELLPMVMGEALRLLHAAAGVIYLVEPASQQIVPYVAVGAELAEFGPLSLEFDEGLAVEAAQSRFHRVIAAPDRVAHDGRTTDGLRLAVPLIAESRPIGVVALVRTDAARLRPVEEELLTLLAGHVSQVLHNSALYDELAQSYRELSLLYDIQQEIVSTIGYRSVLNQIVRKLKTVFDAEDVTIRLVDRVGPEPMMRVAASAGRRPHVLDDRPLASSQIDQRVMSGALVVIPDLLTDPLYSEKSVAAERGFRSLISAPLRARDTIIGAIRVYTGEARDFTLPDQKLLSAVAASAAVAITNAELVRQVEEKNRELQDSYEELRKTQEALVAKGKLALLGEMAATVAHEIRNPMTAIRGFAQRISRKIANDDKTSDYCNLIMEEVDRSNRFIKDVLDFARQLETRLEHTDLNALIRDTLHLVQDELVRNEISMAPQLDLNLPEVEIDRAQIKQVLVNLIQNARQAMGREGTLTLVTENRGRWVVLSVTDTGAGIAPEYIERIWEPFFTTRPHGTGLGLALVRRIMEDHNGRVKVESRVGEGTTFRLYFRPASAPAVRLG
jgi:signal transduction histidine kinase